jgi:hypothetical protein
LLNRIFIVINITIIITIIAIILKHHEPTIQQSPLGEDTAISGREYAAMEAQRKA